MVLDAVGDSLRLADDAEARRRHQHDSAIAFVGTAGDQGVDRSGEAQGRCVHWHVVHASVGDEDGAGHALVRDVGERGAERREQPGAIVGAGLAGLDEAHLEIGEPSEALSQCGAHGFGLLGAVAEFLARALVDDDHDDRGQRVAILARQ